MTVLGRIAGLCAIALCTLPATVAARGRTLVFGRSVQGRALAARVLGPGTAARKIVLVGCIHGEECAGRAILAAAERAPLPAGVQLWLVPTLNPDGEAAGTRQNAHGVDLNRNFPYRWRPLPGPTYYSGPRPRSEPETRAAMRLIARLRPYATVIYHQHEDLVDMAGGDRALARRSPACGPRACPSSPAPSPPGRTAPSPGRPPSSSSSPPGPCRGPR